MEKLQVTRDSLENGTDLDKFAFEAKISFNNNENFSPLNLFKYFTCCWYYKRKSGQYAHGVLV